MDVFFISDDTNEKTEVPEGETIIGRGPFLKIIDKRVSRSHAILQLKDGVLSVKPVHKNPTFYCTNGKSKFIPLEKGIFKQLVDGDDISLLPGAIKFTVCIINQDQTQHYDIGVGVDETRNEIEDGITVEKTFQTTNKEDEDDKESLSKDCAKSILSGVINLAPEAFGSNERLLTTTKVSSPIKKRNLPAWMVNTDSQPTTKKKPTLNKKGTPVKKIASDDYDQCQKRSKKTDKETLEELSEQLSKENKEKSQTSHEESANKLSDSSLSTTKLYNLDNDNGNSTNQDKNDNGNTGISSKEQKQPVCPYGEKCYRKNPAHFEEYSHDISSIKESEDNIDTDLTECEYGTSCYRTNPQHLKEYKHTKDINTEIKTRRSKRKKKDKGKSVLDNASDDDDEGNTYDYDDSFIDDDRSTSSESYSDDDDSDFAPVQNDDIDDDENVNELVSEANEYLKSEKL